MPMNHSTYVSALQLNGRPADPASTSDARLRMSDDTWAITMHADRSSALVTRLRSAGGFHARALAVVDGRELEGGGMVEYHGDAGGGAIAVWIVGQSALEAASERD